MTPYELKAPTLAALAVLCAGCANTRHLERTQELTGCTEVEPVAQQAAEDGFAIEPVLELRWYRGCGRTVVCRAEEPTDCFEAPVPSGPPVVVATCGARRCLKPRREYELPGLTHDETARRAELLARLRELDASNPGEADCSPGGWGGGVTASGEGALILLPMLAVIGVVYVACEAVQRARSDRFHHAKQLEAELAVLDTKLRAEASDHRSTPDE